MKRSASQSLFERPPGPRDVALTVAGFALALSGFLARRAELAKPEAERERWRLGLATALLAVGGLLLFLWGVFAVFFLASVLFDA